jgi:hypothetical protein
MIGVLSDLLQKYIDKRIGDVLIGCIGRIERHDASAMRADVAPLLAYTVSGERISRDFAVLPDIPVLYLWAGDFYIRPEYKRGDLVWVTFATHEIKQGLRGLPDQTGKRLFSRENAAVVHGIARAGWTAPDDFTLEGLIMGHADGELCMQICSDRIKLKGILEVDGDISATGRVDADGEITAKAGDAAVSVSTHTHPYMDTPAGPSNTQSPTPGT